MPREDGEMKGRYAEDELVEDVLQQGEFYDLLTRQLAQNAVTRQEQVAQNAMQDARWFANAIQAFALAQVGKGSVSFPKAVSENVVSENVSKTVNDDSSLSTSKDTMDNMVDRFSKDFDAVKSSVSDMQSQINAVMAVLDKIDIESK